MIPLFSHSIMLRRVVMATMCSAVMAGSSILHAQTGRAGASREADAVLATMTEMWAALEAGDVDRYATFVHADFTQFGENDAYLSEGKSAEVRSMKEYVQRAKGVHTDMHNPQVTVRGDVAWVTYYWTDAGMIDGKRSSSRGKSTRIFVRENGKWLCIHGHYTNAP